MAKCAWKPLLFLKNKTNKQTQVYSCYTTAIKETWTELNQELSESIWDKRRASFSVNNRHQLTQNKTLTAPILFLRLTDMWNL